MTLYGLISLCIDSKNVRDIIKHIKRPITTFGTNKNASVKATDIKYDKLNTRFNSNNNRHNTNNSNNNNSNISNTNNMNKRKHNNIMNNNNNNNNSQVSNVSSIVS